MADIPLPQARRLEREEKFRFRCGPDLPCYTDCCRQLDLALTPYDVLRLRRALGLNAGEFLERYTVVEQSDDSPFPQVYLAMVDDGEASCPFVTADGCAVYRDRPGACRAYPLGRGARLGEDGTVSDFYVVLTEDHCRGFAEEGDQTSATWLTGQGLTAYNEFNDLVLRIIRHPRLNEGFHPDERQLERYLHVLYDLDALREELAAPPDAEEQLLRLACELLENELYPART
jgi:hypothetical protein